MRKRSGSYSLAVPILFALALAVGCAPATPSPTPSPPPPPAPTATPEPTPLPANALLAIPVAESPVIDGAVDELWAQAPTLSVPVAGGANMGSTEVILRALYSGDSIYFLAQWADPTESLERLPWEKQADGTWAKLSTSTTHQENTYYEDKLAFIWNINDSIAGFNQSGCFVTCHAGESPANSGYGSKYTANEGEIGDIWHWKAVRTNPVGQIDDQYVNWTRFSEENPEAGRHSDPKESGGYKNNETEDKTMPAFTSPDMPAPPYWILDGEKQAFSDTFAVGDLVAGIVASAFVGDRGDISGQGAWADGTWTLEWTRRLTTGSEFDVQFDDPSVPYFFGVAVFDNAQVNHAFATGAYQLMFSSGS